MKKEYYLEHLDGFWTIQKDFPWDPYSIYFRFRYSPRTLLHETSSTLEDAQNIVQAHIDDAVKNHSGHSLVAWHKKVLQERGDKTKIWLDRQFDNPSVIADQALYIAKKVSQPLAWLFSASDHAFKKDHSYSLAFTTANLMDKQAYRLYKFESENPHILKTQRMVISKKRAQDLVAVACVAYGVDQPKFVFCPKKDELKLLEKKLGLSLPHWSDNFKVAGYSFCSKKGKGWVFLLQPSLGTLIHELAHHIHMQKAHEAGVKKVAGHSPEFTKILIDMYAQWGMIDKSILEKDARKRGLLGPKDRKTIKARISRFDKAGLG